MSQSSAVETVNLRNLLGLLEHPQFTEGRALAAMAWCVTYYSGW